MPKRILIADDKGYNRDVLSEAFRRRGYHVDAVKDGYEAVEFARHTPVTLGVFDYWMPRMSGVEAMVALNRMNRKVPIVITTSERNRELREAAYAQGARGFFLKPVEIEELMKLVGTLIGEETALAVRRVTTTITIRVDRGDHKL